jgi:hypothetical protein
MQSLFEQTVADQIIQRINALDAAKEAQWGKMNVAQMLAHCQAPFRVYFGEEKMKRGLMGLLFGRIAKKKLFTDKPWPRNLPTAKSFVVVDQKEFEEERAKLLEVIRRFKEEGYNVTTSTHPFFGKMSSQEWSLLAYKHLDHHLQQFGV